VALGVLGWAAVASAAPTDDLFDAVRNDDKKRIGSALHHGASVNAKDADGTTALMLATVLGKFHSVQMLLHAGADVNIGDKDGYTPIHGAGFQGRADIARLLVSQGGMDINDRHSDGYTPMHRAVAGSQPRHAETVKVMLELGANLKAKTPLGETPDEICHNPWTMEVLHEAEEKHDLHDSEIHPEELRYRERIQGTEHEKKIQRWLAARRHPDVIHDADGNQVDEFELTDRPNDEIEPGPELVSLGRLGEL